MNNYNAPEIPQILTLKHWQSTKELPDPVKDASKCVKALDELAKAFKKARFEMLDPFFKQTPSWAQYNHARWRKLCDDLVRDVIVGGVINLREALGEVRNATVREEKATDKKSPLASKSIAFLRKMQDAADALLKELRPDVIETAIRAKETQIADAMIALAAAPLEEIKKHAAAAKSAVSQVMRDPTPATCNKHIGGGSGGLARELAATLAPLAALPSAKGIDYDGAPAAARIAKELLATKPLPATADKSAVTAALKDFLQLATAASKLPKLKL